jgi:hypothetical protein
LLGPNNGAQRASRHFRSGVRSRSLGVSLIAASMLASLIAVPAAASTVTVRIPSSSEITVTQVDRSWWPEEMLVLNWTNCTRTGGWVLSDGTCRGYGSGRYSTYVKPLYHSAGLSDLVARPYARLLAVKAKCSHFLDGDPGYRLRRAGYRAYTWGENIGCRDGYRYATPAVLASHLNFQAEKSTNGGHWKNIKNGNYRWIGIGVWRYGSRVRLVTDFYSG